MCEALKELAEVTADDDAHILSLVAPPAGLVLKAYAEKKIGFMRELSFLCVPADYAAVSCLVVALPMIGWTFPAFGLMKRIKPPSNSYADWKSDCVARNSKIIARIQSSGDPELDSRAFSKTMDEVKAGVLSGPFRSMEQLPYRSPCIAPRCGILECHGGG